MKNGYSHDAISSNINELVASGANVGNARYTALCYARCQYFRRYPSGALPQYLAYPGRGRARENYSEKGEPLKPNPARQSIKAASKLIEDFSGHKARILGKVEFPKNPKTAIAIGNVLGISYETKRDGVKEQYYHRFTKRNSRPLLVVSHDGKQLFILGGEYTFTERGIEDK